MDIPIMRNYKDLNIDYQGGNLWCEDLDLSSLSGCPNHITGGFDCGNSKLSNLVDGPQIVDSYYNCVKAELTSLVGCPDYISGYFDCSDNQISTLIHGPQRVDGCYWCSNNRLTDLVGCASHIEKTLSVNNNQITSLVGIHKIIKNCTRIEFDSSKITQGGIGLLLIDNLTDIASDSTPFKIIKNYLGTGTKGMMACRSELIANGYDAYAKL